MEEQGEEMLDGGILAQERCEAANLVREGSADMLGNILAEIADARHYPGQHDFLLEQL